MAALRGLLSKVNSNNAVVSPLATSFYSSSTFSSAGPRNGFGVTYHRNELDEDRRFPSLGRRMIHKCPSSNAPSPTMEKRSSSTDDERSRNTSAPSTSEGRDFAGRFRTTFEAAISKLLPGGFAWQLGSIVAEESGMTADSVGFALTTGAFDALAVVAGHSAYFTAKKMITGNKAIHLAKEYQTGALLGSAAMLSGSIWQPSVNFFADKGFTTTLLGTGAVCTAMFMTGLRLGRRHLPSLGFNHIEPNGYHNLKADAELSLAIGGATACFVGTDVSFANNFLRPIVGVEEHMAPLAGCATAGFSTFLGFMAVQTAENVVRPPRKCWTDPPKPSISAPIASS